MKDFLAVGKLPVELLAGLLAQQRVQDPDVILGPGIGLDCAVVSADDRLLVLKSDPITFATEEIGWYAVQVACNDIATCGAKPRWFLATLLLPEGQTTLESVERINGQISQACREAGITVIGGHSEITYGLPRPIVVGTLIGQVEKERLVTPQGASPGDRILITKGVPIEATAILARELPERLVDDLSPADLDQARGFLHDPGISVLRDARVALQAGKVTAMHDPTEGGLASALWELAEASSRSLEVDPSAVPVPALSARLCRAVGIDPLAAIASGALLLTAPAGEAEKIRKALESEAIPCAEIGTVQAGPPAVWQRTQAGKELLRRPERDEIARLFGE